MDKIKEKVRDAKDTLTYKLTGNKYHNNLLGESLSDMLRKATAKTLVTPDENLNQQVVTTIQQEASGGRDTKEIVSLLKKRLRTDNPQKQWLGVQLFQKVLAECGNVLGMHQEELLQEVARVMARPAKPETEAGKAARHAAKELLRQYGRAGTTAFRAAHQDLYGRTPMSVPGSGYGAYAGGVYPGYTAPGYGVPGQGYPEGERANGALNVEKQSLVEELNLLMEKARSNTELLSDMLVNAGGASSDEFERDLINDLLNEVRELRGVFSAYLEQLQGMEGPEMEVLMVQALEAADMLDGCIALQKDVSSNQDPNAVPAPNGTAAAGGSQTQAATAAAPAPAPAPKQNDDLIALDDLADAMNATALGGGAPAPAAGQPAYDPFAASAAAPVLSPYASAGGAPPAPGYPPMQQGQPQQAPVPVPVPGGQPTPGPGMRSAFENMFAQPGAGAQAFTSLAAAAPGGQPGPAPGLPPYPATPGHTMPMPMPQAGSPYGAPPQGMPPQYPSSPPQYGGMAPPPAYGAPPAQAPMPAYAQPPMPAPGPYPGAPPPAPYAAPAPAPAPAPLPSVSSNNPFAAAPPALGNVASYNSSGFLPMPPSVLPAAAGPAGAAPGAGSAGGMPPMPPAVSSNNPFAAAMPPAPSPAPSGSAGGAAPAPAASKSSVDQEWDLFFAERAAAQTKS